MDYYEALRAIARPIRASEMPRSLEPMRRLLAELGSPECVFSSVVVTGSVGKGTAAYQLAALLQESTLPVGLFTGPHLHRFRERFAINGSLISREAFTKGVETVLEAAERAGLPYSTFELATALAVWWFAEQGVKAAVLEVGIGGRWDAVNALPNTLGTFTPIEGEHLAMLGGSLQTIAYHKAGIIQPGGFAISAIQKLEVEAVLEHEAEFKNARIVYSETPALTACRALMERGIVPAVDLPAETPDVHLPGRMEQVAVNGREIVIDGGHTPLAAMKLRGVLKRLSHDEPVRLIVGMLRDKSAHDFLHVFDESGFQITLTTAPGHRATTPENLLEQAQFQRAAVEIEPDLSAALEQAQNAKATVVITGSLRMAAAAREFLGLLTLDELEEAQRTRTIFEGGDYLKRL